MGAASLVQMVQNTIGRNINNVQDLGETSYELARPILKQITNPEHLRALELRSPQIADNDAELWLSFIRRDIPSYRDKIAEPHQKASYCYDTYCKLKEEEQQEQQRQEDELRQVLMQHDKHKEANKSHIVDKVIAQNTKRLPKYADGRLNPLAGKSSTHAPSLRNARGGQQIIRALRNQTRQAVHQKNLAKPIATKQIAPQPPAGPMTESKIERSMRLALEEENRKQKEAEDRKEVKQIMRRQRAKEATRQPTTTSMDIDLPWETASPAAPITTPPRRPTPPKEAYLSPPPDRIKSDHGSNSTGKKKPGWYLPKPFDSSTTLPGREANTPKGPDPAELERKSGSPIPDIKLNDSQKADVPVFAAPASSRKPTSIFAPKPKKQRVV